MSSMITLFGGSRGSSTFSRWGRLILASLIGTLLSGGCPSGWAPEEVNRLPVADNVAENTAASSDDPLPGTPASDAGQSEVPDGGNFTDQSGQPAQSDPATLTPPPSGAGQPAQTDAVDEPAVPDCTDQPAQPDASEQSAQSPPESDPPPGDPGNSGDQSARLYFTVEPLDGPRDLVVSCRAYADGGQPLPEGTYTWSFDSEVDAGPMATHAEIKHTFRTRGVHLVGLTLTIAGAVLPVGCVNLSGRIAETVEVSVWPMVSGVVEDASGNPMPGVRVSAGGVPQAATTDVHGWYGISVPDGWSGTITPFADGFTFSPVSRQYDAVHDDLDAADFTGAAIGTNPPPTPNDQDVETDENTAVRIELSATNPGAGPLAFVIQSVPRNGTLQDTATGATIQPDQLPYRLGDGHRDVTYYPAPDYLGSDEFGFNLDGAALSGPLGKIRLAIRLNNHPPTASPQSVDANEDVPKSITLVGSDPDGNPLTYRIVTLPLHGTLKDNTTGQFITAGQLPYTLVNAGHDVTYANEMFFIDVYTFEFCAFDGRLSSAPATVTITVHYGNHPPVADTITVNTALNTPALLTLHATDPHNDTLCYSIRTLPAHGTLRDNVNQHVILPADVPYELVSDGNQLVYTPDTGFIGLDGLVYSACDGHADSPNANVNINVQGWAPPIGVPNPPFGVNEKHTMYVGQQWNYGSGLEPYRDAGNGPYTHYVDKTSPQATDTNNTFGTPAKPRLTVPENLPAGSVVEVHGGTYNYTIGAVIPLGGAGTTIQPIFIRGISSGAKALLAKPVRLTGQYVIVENVDLNAWSTSNDCGFEIGAGRHHVALRHSEVRNGPDATTSAVAIGGSSDSAKAENIVIYDTVIHDNGDWQATYDQDHHGIGISSFAQNIWIVDNEMYHNSGDGIQINGSNASTHHVYVGRCTAWENKQCGFWSKYASDVIFSQNTAHNHVPSDSSPGAGFGWQYGPERVWFLFNHSYDNTDGITGPSADFTGRSTYIVGNVIHDCSNVGINLWNNCSIYVLNNTITSVGTGIDICGSQALYAVNNVIANMTGSGYSHLVVDGNMSSASRAQYNLFYQGGGAVRINWGWATQYNVAQFQANVAPPQAQANLEGNPLFASPSVDDYHVLIGSPAIDHATAAGIAQQVYNEFQTRYGLNIAVDFDGVPRPVGAAYDMGAYER
jgi:hypothetical protein